MPAIAVSSILTIESFDPQGLAMTAWAFASLKVDDRPLLDAIAAASMRTIWQKVKYAFSDGDIRSLSFSILALSWALAFLPPFDPETRAALQGYLQVLGHRSDKNAAATASVTSQHRRQLGRLSLSASALVHRGEMMESLASGLQGSSTYTRGAEADKPKLLIRARGMLVLCKPPGWEVDSVANQSGAACLSEFLQDHFGQCDFPLLHSVGYGFGFVHRLDVASSGLVLVGSTFEGLFALQWQKSVYGIEREYLVVSHGLEVFGLRTVDVKVKILVGKVMRTQTGDVGLPAASYLRTIAQLLGSAVAGCRHSVIAIRIHTGRRHQIRAHTRAIGHPTACDGWYAPSATTLFSKGMFGPAPARAWVRTPRWDGELSAPPQELEGQVFTVVAPARGSSAST